MRRAALLLTLLAVACDDPDNCTEIGAARCADEGTLEVCAQSNDGRRWTRGSCPEQTPSCVEHGASEAVCVAEQVGECDFDSFEDRCVDDRTLDDCVRFGDEGTDGARQHLRCPEGQRCGAVPPDSVGDGRPPHAGHACFTPRPPHEPSAVVALLHGEAHLDDAPAPTAPFRVRPGQRLRLAEGARAVLLVKERASRVSGPSDIDPYAFQPERPTPSPEGRAVVEALSGPAPEPPSPDETLLQPTPGAGGIIRLLVGEGVPGASRTIDRFAWRCEEDCGRTVELRQLEPINRVVWRGNGERSVDYDGPELEPGARYQLTLGEHRYSVETLAPFSMRELLSSTADWPPAEQLAVIAAVHLYRGSRAAATEAIRRGMVDRPRDEDLGALLESLRGR